MPGKKIKTKNKYQQQSKENTSPRNKVNEFDVDISENTENVNNKLYEGKATKHTTNSFFNIPPTLPSELSTTTEIKQQEVETVSLEKQKPTPNEIQSFLTLPVQEVVANTEIVTILPPLPSELSTPFEIKQQKVETVSLEKQKPTPNEIQSFLTLPVQEVVANTEIVTIPPPLPSELSTPFEIKQQKVETVSLEEQKRLPIEIQASPVQEKVANVVKSDLKILPNESTDTSKIINLKTQVLETVHSKVENKPIIESSPSFPESPKKPYEEIVHGSANMNQEIEKERVTPEFSPKDKPTKEESSTTFDSHSDEIVCSELVELRNGINELLDLSRLGNEGTEMLLAQNLFSSTLKRLLRNMEELYKIKPQKAPLIVAVYSQIITILSQLQDEDNVIPKAWLAPICIDVEQWKQDSPCGKKCETLLKQMQPLFESFTAFIHTEISSLRELVENKESMTQEEIAKQAGIHLEHIKNTLNSYIKYPALVGNVLKVDEEIKNILQQLPGTFSWSDSVFPSTYATLKSDVENFISFYLQSQLADNKVWETLQSSLSVLINRINVSYKWFPDLNMTPLYENLRNFVTQLKNQLPSSVSNNIFSLLQSLPMASSNVILQLQEATPRIISELTRASEHLNPYLNTLLAFLSSNSSHFPIRWKTAGTLPSSLPLCFPGIEMPHARAYEKLKK